VLGAIAVAACICVALGVAGVFSAFSATSYPLAAKAPPVGWNIQASWPEMTLRDLCGIAHTVAWVDIQSVEERWVLNGVEWSSYQATVRQYVLNKSGSAEATISIVQLGGNKDIYYNYPSLEPGRSYIVVLVSEQAGGRTNRNYVLHPVGIYPLVADDVVETWWPAPPWHGTAPYLGVDQLLTQLRRGGG
jgi:hypothetical protein